jgi:ABC-type sugar transport system permease subunit
MIYYSFTSWNGFSEIKKWIGLKNYIRIFSDPTYFKPLFNSIYYFFGGLVQIALAFLFACILNTKVVGKNIFKGIYFFPYLINTVAISLMFMAFFQPDGTLNSFLNLIGFKNSYSIMWLDSTKLNNYCLAFTSVWYYFGYNFIILLGAMQSISSDILEAAAIDGANEWQKARYITIPSVLPIIKLSLILNISGAIGAYGIPYIMTGGSNGTDTFVIECTKQAFTLSHTGRASAMAVIVLIIVSITTILSNKLIKEDN